MKKREERENLAPKEDEALELLTQECGKRRQTESNYSVFFALESRQWLLTNQRRFGAAEPMEIDKHSSCGKE